MLLLLLLLLLRSFPFIASKDNHSYALFSGENKIGLKEFISIQREAEKAKFFTEDSQSELIAALKCFDLRGDNTLSKDDLKGILSDYDDDIIDDLLKAVCAPDDERLPITGMNMY